MTQKFKAAIGDHTGENWPICWTGQDEFGKHWSVTTNQVHGSELHTLSQGAKGDAELIASLLNWYYGAGWNVLGSFVDTIDEPAVKHN